MNLLMAASLRNIFIPTNLPMMVNIDHSVGDNYVKSYLNGDDEKCKNIERSINLIMSSMHVNAWEDYLIMMSHYLCREHRPLITGEILSRTIFVPGIRSTLKHKPIPLPHKAAQDILYERFYQSKPRRLLSLTEAAGVIAGQWAHSREN